VKRSAGIVLWRQLPGSEIEVLLGHMGGPYWARKDAGAWTIPKGEIEDGEEPDAVARREFHEEVGTPAPAGAWVDLGEVRQSGGKVVQAWAVEGDLDPAHAASNTFELEWPPTSGHFQSISPGSRQGSDPRRDQPTTDSGTLTTRARSHSPTALA
jgi:predicted NUDIX family NTP pyrophosphohydrolase